MTPPGNATGLLAEGLLAEGLLAEGLLAEKSPGRRPADAALRARLEWAAAPEGSASVVSPSSPVVSPPALDPDPEPADSGSAVTKRVLYVDDLPENLHLIARVFQQRPQINLITAMVGQDAIELAREERPDLILLDLHLPDMSGEQALAHLKDHERTRAIPVVIFSADSGQGLVARLRDGGAAGFLTKPFRLRDLLDMVDTMLFGETPALPPRR